MLRRWHVLLLIVVTLTAFCVLAAEKLRATPKYDCIQAGMTSDEVEAILGDPTSSWAAWVGRWDCDEGSIGIEFKAVPQAGQEHDPRPEFVQIVFDKSIVRRPPFQRLAWLVGWREPRPPAYIY